MSEKFVSLLAMFVLRLALETVRSVHLSCFVVAAVDEHVLRVEPLERERGEDDLDGPRPAVDEVAVHEEVVLLGRLASERVQVQEIVVLAW